MVYKDQGVSGLIKKYFKHDEDGMYILWNQEQMFPLQGYAPYPAFGEDTNVEYIAYILFRHHIYLSYRWIDEDGILMISIVKELSDMNELKIKK